MRLGRRIKLQHVTADCLHQCQLAFVPLLTIPLAVQTLGGQIMHDALLTALNHNVGQLHLARAAVGVVAGRLLLEQSLQEECLSWLKWGRVVSVWGCGCVY